MVAAVVEPERLIFVDECGTHTSLGPIYGYAPRGERLLLSVPRKRGKNTTLLSSMTLSGMGPSLVVEGATTARVFEAYVEKVLVPSLRAGQIVVVDNLGAHRPKRIRELIEQQGRYAQKLWMGDFVRHAVYLPKKAIERPGAPTLAGRGHRYAKTTPRRAVPRRTRPRSGRDRPPGSA